MSTTILIADDDPVSRQMLSSLLSKWDFRVVTVSNGVEALRLLKAEHAPRLAILDWMMPELDGLQVIRSLRALRPQPYTYVLVLTAKDRLEDIVQGLAAGADDYLIKPFHAEELKARLLVGKRILDLQHRLMSALEIAEFRGTHDALTGVYNRAAIVEVLRREAESRIAGRGRHIARSRGGQIGDWNIAAAVLADENENRTRPLDTGGPCGRTERDAANRLHAAQVDHNRHRRGVLPSNC